MEKIVEQGLLYDFYGELLTEHQRRIYEDVVLNDMSLSEIAQEQENQAGREYTIWYAAVTGRFRVMKKDFI